MKGNLIMQQRAIDSRNKLLVSAKELFQKKAFITQIQKKFLKMLAFQLETFTIYLKVNTTSIFL